VTSLIKKYDRLYNYDRLWKLRTLFDMLNGLCAKFYTPSEHLVVDEVEVSILVGYCATLLDDWCPTFWGQCGGPISMGQMTYHWTFDTWRWDISIWWVAVK
jgi:hypothetical protein